MWHINIFKIYTHLKIQVIYIYRIIGNNLEDTKMKAKMTFNLLSELNSEYLLNKRMCL